MGEGLHKQAKMLTDRQIKRVLAEVATGIIAPLDRYYLNSRYDAAQRRMKGGQGADILRFPANMIVG
jgi:hypothetical protein